MNLNVKRKILVMTLTQLKMNASAWAEEDAIKDLEFSGDIALAKISDPILRQNIRSGLVEYARSAASRTVSVLELKGYLRDVKLLS